MHLSPRTLYRYALAIMLMGLFNCWALCAHQKTAAAQSMDSELTGIVTDSAHNPVTGATITVQDQSITALSGVDGYFKLRLKPGTYTLSITHVSYLPKELKLSVTSGQNEPRTIELQTKPGSSMEEVVVVGYGTQKKINLTGAVAQIGSEALEDRPSPNLTRMLQGALPNLNIKMVDGSPTRSATYNLRGATSIGAGGSALVLIDGVEGDPNLVNPNDVESVSILKDASSAAIYGSRAAFGVVLITTKSAKKGRVKVDVNSSYTINKRIITPKLVTNGYQWAKNFDEAFNAWYDYKSHPISVNNIYPFSLEYLDELKKHDEDPSLPQVVYNEQKERYEYFGNTDWYNLVYKNSMPAVEEAVSISGGSEKADYYISGRYYYQDGIFNYLSDKFNKYNLRAKGTVRIAPWISIQNNTDISSFNYRYPMFADGDGNIWRQFEHQGYPMAVIYNPDGSYTHSGVYTGVASYIEGNNKSDLNNFFVRNTAGVTLIPIKNRLTFKADITFSKKIEDETRTNNFINYSIAPGRTDRFGRSLLRQLNTNESYLGSNITGEYTKSFGSHNLKLLGGYNVESFTSKLLNASRDGILVEDKPDFNLMDGLNYGINGGGLEWSYIGWFYRLNYDFKNRYLLELNGRYDGSSKFPSTQRFGFFPSVSAGWRVSEESFFQPLKSFINEFKLRGSYGSLGNGNVAAYRYLEIMSVAKTSVILNGVQTSYTQLPNVIPNGLTWERSTTFDLGADLTLLDRRLDVVFDWYDRKTTGMFTQAQPLPAVFGAALPFGNYADLSTKGWELSLSWKDNTTVFGKPFQYSFSGSLWDSRSFITKFNNPTKTLTSTYYEGHEIGELWGYTTLGFFTSEQDIAQHANQDFLQNSNNREWLPGDLKFADLNGDNVIDQGKNTVDEPGDRRIIGNTSPRYQYGFNVALQWNGIGLSAFFQGIGKRDWYFAPEAGLFWGPYNRPYGYQPAKMMNDFWTEEHPDAYFPRFRGYTALNTNRSLGAPQTRYLQDASYMRIKNISLDYALPTRLLSRLRIAQAKIYVTGQNLFTFSGLFKHTDNFDPEVLENPVGELTNGSGQGYAYPMLKSITFGLNLSF
ncbi:SusC/RagA family TonB-linked outer membrane protein [Niabella beijingensis]|uniref:SusC/RagA family TonB-linked outer membrane protein n=1 Tax=Niabella beijingensis TaxID=2872700 RepID=UPI001CBF5775|nr:TonB-dependent receptor [Niabella beijingensis]MBZ4190137.1 TonB-dependent receptor [Niabella beijingensis]